MAASLLLGACADDLQQELAPDAGEDTGGSDAGQEPGNITHTDNGDGTTTSVVNATSQEDWIYLDLKTGEEKTPMNPGASNGWDLGFRRFSISLNGGATGSGGVVALLVEDDFAAIQAAPAGIYESDNEDGDDDNEDPDIFFDRADTLWYDYDPATHVLTPREVSYVLRSVEGDYYKLRVDDYYSDAGTAGFVKFTWGPVDPWVESLLSIDASAQESWVYVDLESGQVVAPETPESSLAWDLAVRRTGFRSNSGSSGPGAGGVIATEADNFYALNSAPSEGYLADEVLPIPGPPGSGEESRNGVLDGWYNYNPTTHEVSPKNITYVVRHADGDVSKLQVKSFSDGNYELRWNYAGDGATEFVD